MQATREGRGVVAGHGTGLKQLPEINAFAAAGLASDHEAMSPEEAWEKMSRGVFLMLKPRRNGTQNIIPYFVERELRDWSNLSLTTDDRDAAETLEKGSSDYNLRIAIESGAPVEPAYAMTCTPCIGTRCPSTRIPQWPCQCHDRRNRSRRVVNSSKFEVLSFMF